LRVKVRFVDLGIVKTLNRITELREIDQKFFNCPLKALHCSINLDNDVFDPETCEYQNEHLKMFKLTKEARKYFTKIIYKRVLFAKIVNFTYNDAESLMTEDAVCQVILGAQFHRGIIDIFMYLLSKFDRSYYTVLRQYHTQQSQLIKQGVIPKAYDSETETSNLVTTTSNDLTTIQSYNQADGTSENNNKSGEKVLDSEILQILKEEYIQSYGNRTQTAEVYNNDFTEDDESTIEETEQALYSNSINREDHRLHETIIFSSDNNSSYFSVSDDDDDDSYFPSIENVPTKAEVETLELTDQKSKSFNYSEPLRFDSIHLPPIKSCQNNDDRVNNTYQAEPVTIQASNRRLLIRDANGFNVTPIVLPPAQTIKPGNLMNVSNNINSDTDTSLTGQCCASLQKFRRNSASKLRQKFMTTLSKSKEAPELSIQKSYESNTSAKSKKVKFQER